MKSLDMISEFNQNLVHYEFNQYLVKSLGMTIVHHE